MVDYSNVAAKNAASYPIDIKNTTPLLKRIEPIITPKLLQSRYLKGVDGLDYTDDEYKDQINLAINETEILTNLPLNKMQVSERVMYDARLYQNFVYMRMNKKPILSIENVNIESSDGQMIFQLPPQWLEVGNTMKLGQINILPILNVFGATNVTLGTASNAGLLFIQAISQYRWLPGFFTVYYTVGVCHEEGQLPVVINEIVGLTATMEILSNMQNRNITNSQSLSQDGISQSVSSKGPEIYQTRIIAMAEKRQQLINRVKGLYKQKLFVDNI